ncbi:MAG: hypothetical protein WBC40_09965, partial [Halobacteriota archaeon]
YAFSVLGLNLCIFFIMIGSISSRWLYDFLTVFFKKWGKSKYSKEFPVTEEIFEAPHTPYLENIDFVPFRIHLRCLPAHFIPPTFLFFMSQKL